MRIFMSYASEQKPQAEAIAFSLRSRGHTVFLDRDDLPEGTSYDDRIATAVDRSDLMIFLITPESVAQGRYTLTELHFARAKWQNPSLRVLPVMLAPTPVAAIPSYLKAVSLLEPQGNVAAEVAFATERLRGVERAVNKAAIAGAVGAVLAFIAGLMRVFNDFNWTLILPKTELGTPSLQVGLLLAVLFGALYWWLGERTWWKLLLLALMGLVGWICCVDVIMNFFDSIRVVRAAPNKEFSNIIAALPEAQKSEFQTDIDAIKLYFGAFDASARVLSGMLAYGLAGLACFIPIICGLAAIDRAFRSMTRLILGMFFAFACGATGSLTGLFSGIDAMSRSLAKAFRFVGEADLTFALLYLPWMVAIPAFMVYWLVRGQER
jgi:hypothetical protein